MIVKVKEPQPPEIQLFRPGQIVFTYFHFAASRRTDAGVPGSGIVAIAYETIHDRQGRLPLPHADERDRREDEHSGGGEVSRKADDGPRHSAGRRAGRGAGACRGAGRRASSAPTPPRWPRGWAANVVIMDINLDRLRYLDDVMPANVHTIFSDAHTVREHLLQADLVIGAVLIPGAKAPRLVTAQDLEAMKNGSVIVDVAIDQGGCVETSRPTTHQQPTYVVEGVVHYCVTNMPGAVGRTSTIALCNATLPYALQIANKGYEKAAAEDPGLGEGINLVGARVTNPSGRRRCL